jgi:ATP-dependent DNA helicase RecG
LGCRASNLSGEQHFQALEVGALLKVVHGEMARPALQVAMGLRNAEHFRKAYLVPAVASGCLEMTLPDTPRSTKQRYRLTAKGRQWLQAQPGP